MPKKHDRQIPPHQLSRALELLGFRVATDDPQQALIDLLDNFRLPDELQAKSQLSQAECVFILNLRDIATACECKIKN